MTANLLPRIAYFCMEYGIHESLPIYSGGLGILAGDYVKSAHDLRLPLTAVGIFWSEGYTVQRVGGDAMPYDQYVPTPRHVLEPTGVEVEVTIRGRVVPITVHRLRGYDVAPLLLLEPTREEDRWITRRLYGGGGEDRVAQEIILGVGGVRALRALGLEVDVYHFNEGHALFAGLELLREQMAAGLSFAEAQARVKEEIVFTTHTPVVAGNESHAVDLLLNMGADLGVFTRAQLVELGGEPFGMTVAALRLCRIANAVADLHGHTSRRMWRDVSGSAPIVSVTNGVHPQSWQDPRLRAAHGQGTVWETHQTLKRELLAEVKARGGPALAEDRLLIGFARRAATYKRSDLIFSNPELVTPLLQSGRLQILFAGKAHPQDLLGKRIIGNLVSMARRFPNSVYFCENYEIRIARYLVRGCDVWLNNPRRPLEASGTSGMKAAMNGVLNLSILDGWWPEGCEHGVNGWQIGDAFEGPGQDERDAKSLASVLEHEVLPTYYNDRGRWVDMMRASIEMSQWLFSSHRMIEEYYTRLYRVEDAAASAA